MKRTIEIEDTLADRVESAQADLRDAFTEFRTSNPDMPVERWEPHDRIFEIADGAVPIYTSEIKGLWYLYADEFEQAYQDAGIGHGDEANHQQVAIFCYLEAQLWDEARRLQQDAEQESDHDDDAG